MGIHRHRRYNHQRKLTEGFHLFWAPLLQWKIMIFWSPFRNYKSLWHSPNEEKCICQAKCDQKKNSFAVLYSNGNTEAWLHIIFWVKTETPCFPHQQALMLVSSNSLEKILPGITSMPFFFRATFFKKFHHEVEREYEVFPHTKRFSGFLLNIFIHGTALQKAFHLFEIRIKFP